MIRDNIVRVSKFLLYLISHLVPKNEDIWVFGASWGERYDGNPKYLYEYVNQNESDRVIPVWISKDEEVVSEIRSRGFSAYHRDSLQGIFIVLRANLVFISHNLSDVGWHCGGSTIVQLWHGDPLKKMGSDKTEDQSFLSKLASKHTSFWDYMIVGSQKAAEIFSDSYNIEPEKTLPLGYPRNDVFNAESKYYPKCINKEILDILDNNRTIVYLPTWRTAFGEKNSVTNPEMVREAALNISDEDTHILAKFHPHEESTIDDFEDIDNATILSKETDIYPILSLSSALITDYSSVMFDYLHSNQPIILFAYDLDRYRDERGFYYDFQSIAPGPILKSPEELGSILSMDILDDNWANLREQTEDEIEISGTNASKRIFDFFYTRAE